MTAMLKYKKRWISSAAKENIANNKVTKFVEPNLRGLFEAVQSLME